MTYYEVLEIDPGASFEVVRVAYKSLVQRHHPDRNPGDSKAAERTRAVIDAYRVLSDPARRAEYDRQLEAPTPSRVSAGPAERPRTAGQAVQPLQWAALYVLVGLIALIGLIVLLAWAIGQTPGRLRSGPVPLPEPIAALVPLPDPISVVAPSDSATPIARESERYLAPAALTSEARTLHDFVTGFSVRLTAKGDGPNPLPALLLSIESIDIVVGEFEAERFLALLERRRDFVISRLREDLASAHAPHLLGADGDGYLRRLIVGSINRTTGASELAETSYVTAGPRGSYGAVDATMPFAYELAGPR